MKRILFACTICIGLFSCGGGKHEPVVPQKDSATEKTNIEPGTGTGTVDSTNGAIVPPIDTVGQRHP